MENKSNSNKITISLKTISLIVGIMIGFAVIIGYGTSYVNNRINEIAFPKEEGIEIRVNLKNMSGDIKEIKEILKDMNK